MAAGVATTYTYDPAVPSPRRTTARGGAATQRVALLTTLAVLGGCGSTTDRLRFEYTALSQAGFIDQVLAIENTASKAVAPTLKLTPLDASGDAVQGVSVATAFGSDHGNLVIPPKTAHIDVLRFRGVRRYDAENVKVDVVKTEEARAPSAYEEPVVERLDRRGRRVDTSETFSALTITNANAEPVSLRAVLLEYDDPPEGEPQQAIRETPLAGLIRLDAGERSTVKLPAALRDRVVGSVKVYPSR